MESREQESTFMRRTLAAAGLSTDFNAAIAHLSATYVRDHDHFSRLLTEMEPDLRQEMYDAMRPHLSFEPWSCDQYIAHAKEMAEREQLPILSATGKLMAFKPAQDVSSGMKQAQEALDKALADRTLVLVCAKCTAQEAFYGTTEQTKVDVVLKARRAGWIYDGTGDNPVEICPDCPTSLRGPHEAHYGKPVNA